MPAIPSLVAPLPSASISHPVCLIPCLWNLQTCFFNVYLCPSMSLPFRSNPRFAVILSHQGENYLSSLIPCPPALQSTFNLLAHSDTSKIAGLIMPAIPVNAFHSLPLPSRLQGIVVSFHPHSHLLLLPFQTLPNLLSHFQLYRPS